MAYYPRFRGVGELRQDYIRGISRSVGSLLSSQNEPYMAYLTEYSWIRHGISIYIPFFYLECHFNSIKLLLPRSKFRGLDIHSWWSHSAVRSGWRSPPGACLNPAYIGEHRCCPQPIFVGKIGELVAAASPLVTCLKCHEGDRDAEWIRMICGI